MISVSASYRKGLNGVLAGLQGGLGLVAICSDGLLDGKLATASMTPGLALPTRAEFDVISHWIRLSSCYRLNVRTTAARIFAFGRSPASTASIR